MYACSNLTACLANLYQVKDIQEPILLIWTNFKPNMDK